MLKSIYRGISAAGLVLMLLTGASTARASLLAISDPVLGPNSLVLDTSTGLEWLNMRFTVNKSTNQVNAALAPGGAFASFQWADSFEVGHVVTDAGVPKQTTCQPSTVLPAGYFVCKP